MADRQFTLVLEAALTSGGAATISYTVPPNEKLTLNSMVYNSTGIFNITDIRDSAGYHYTNASPATEIPSGVLANGANNFNSLKDFSAPIIIEGGMIFYVELEDSSAGANTVTLVFAGIRSSRN